MIPPTARIFNNPTRTSGESVGLEDSFVDDISICTKVSFIKPFASLTLNIGKELNKYGNNRVRIITVFPKILLDTKYSIDSCIESLKSSID